MSTLGEYRIQWHDTPSTIDPETWNRLLDAQAEPTPFMRHEYLLAMHESGSAVAASGWQPRFLTLTLGDEVVAACASYLKAHSYGEYVFDWAWADAYRRHGLRYYPKALCAVPFTPVPGSRLLAADAAAKLALVQALTTSANEQGLSSAHSLFMDPSEVEVFRQAGWMIREGIQFHWTNDPSQPYSSLSDLLSRLHREKRKKVQQERNKVAQAGVTFTRHVGHEITVELWDFFYRCYELTYQAHHSTPYLTRAFFARMADRMPECWLLFVAWQAGQPIASSLIAIDPERRHAWGRYWGATAFVSCLHFEACYYQPLSWCIENGYQTFEGGAQGEHKMARGLLPVRTASAHWLRDHRFASAVEDFLAEEGRGIDHYADELRDRNPFKAESRSEDPPI